MSAAWTIVRESGAEMTFEEAVISNVSRRLINQDIDTAEVSFGRGDLRHRSGWNANEWITIKRDDAIWFQGLNILARPGASGTNVRLINTLAGPWWYLSNLIYTQPVSFVVSGAENPTPAGASLALSDFETESKISSTIFLGDDQDGHRVNTHDQILDALNFALAKGAQFQLGTIDAGSYVPQEELRATSCAEIIRRCLRWTPDQVPWFDYTTTPPTLHIRTRANRALFTVGLADEETEEVELAERRDLQLSGVRIEYLAEHERTDFRFRTLDVDEAGDPSGFGALILPIELYGSYLSGTTEVTPGVFEPVVIEAEPVPAGLAAQIYEAYSVSPFEGSVRLARQEVGAQAWTARTLRVLGGHPSWATMTADIQSSVDTISTGRTELTIGPARHLGPNDLIALARQGKTRVPGLPETFTRTGGGSPTPSTLPAAGGDSDPRLSFGPLAQPEVILRVRHTTDVSGGHHFDTDDSVTFYDHAAPGETQQGISIEGHNISDKTTILGPNGVRIGAIYEFLPYLPAITYGVFPRAYRAYLFFIAEHRLDGPY